MGLTSPAVTELTVESGSKALLAEWLAFWFDGAEHTVGGIARVFPRVAIGFDQGPVGQPMGLNGNAECEIRVVSHPRSEREDPVAPGQALVRDRVTLHFWVRSNTGEPGKAAGIVNAVGELLFGVLRNPNARADLARKGVAHLRPRKPEPAVCDEWRLSVVECGVEVSYLITGGD